MLFIVEVYNDDFCMYVFLYVFFKLWVMDYEVNCVRYGCVFVEKKIVVMG